MLKRHLFFLTLLIATALTALVVFANRELLFRTEIHETSDFAVNALQIERAKHFQEQYGNYSRYHFNHPGPAFFYVYALAEIVLHDWLHLVPSPHNAHVFGGIVLQGAFFAIGLMILSQLLERRAVLTVGLLLGALHFAAADHAFASIWPPHVLLMPFFTFLAATAAVAVGRLRVLPWLVLSGCFLAHGHVAQPLFVVVLT
ncbi:MAG TPA: hypothetical protein VHF69_11835, partial [Candidatus Synoicihabitans sp.]|nr:hypothetical protein [Candidatus Synoicihabitans sp.]